MKCRKCKQEWWSTSNSKICPYCGFNNKKKVK